MRVLDLFSGEGNWTTAFRERGHEAFSVDFDDHYAVDLVADVLTLSASDLPWRPDVILASPPCQGFTVARIGINWEKGLSGPMSKRYPHRVQAVPRTAKAELGVALVAATLRLIEEAEPSFWLMENPVGKLRKHPVVAGVERRQVTYCQYGRAFRKPTDLWGGFPPSLVLRRPCGLNKPCHVAAPRGSRTGVQGRKRLESTAVPPALSLAVCLAAEIDLEAGLRYEASALWPASPDPEPTRPAPNALVPEEGES